MLAMAGVKLGAVRSWCGAHWRLGLIALAAAFTLETPTVAGEAMRTTVWQLPLDHHAEDLPPASSFKLLACGSDGGPPLQILQDWSDFQLCKPEADGLREVYLEYDGTREAAALRQRKYLDPHLIGTSEALFPVIASALFDEAGVLRAIRLVTDPRADAAKPTHLPRLRPRNEHYLLGDYLADRFGISPADCHERPATRRERPVLGMFVKRECTRIVGGISYLLVQHYLRKAGQANIDAETGQLSTGEFESWTRMEVRVVGPPSGRGNSISQ